MTTFVELMKIWYDAAIAGLYDGNDRGDGKLMLGCPVWGKDYVELLVNHCLPSLLGADNLAANAGRARLVLYVDPAHLTDLTFMLRHLELKGIELRIHQIPEEVMKAWRESPKDLRQSLTYQLLGTIQDILVQTAGRQGMSFHQLAPDHSYNARWAPNFFKLIDGGVSAIAQLGICADIGAAAEQFKAFRQADGSLVIPDRDLGNIAFRNLHRRMQGFLMNKASIPDRMPPSHFFFWQGRDKLVLSSCHMNAAYLSAAHCAAAKSFMPATMDSCLPKLMGTKCLVPTVAHGLTFIELSGDDKPSNDVLVPFEMFAARAWGQAKFRDPYLWYTRQRCEIPIKPQSGFLTDDQIERQHADVIDRLVAGKGGGASLEFLQGIWPPD